MTVRPKGSGYMVDFMVAGKRHREFGFRDATDAGVWELQARAALMKGQPLPPASTAPGKAASGMTMKELVRHSATVHWSSFKSSEKLVRNAELFAAFVGEDLSVAEGLAYSKITDYVEDMQERERSGSTINRHLSSVSVLIEQAKSLGHLLVQPRIPWQQETEGRLRWFTEEEEASILASTRLWGLETEAIFLEFLAYTGCRVGEALKLDWDCFSKGFMTVTFWETKAGNHRTLPLARNQSLRAALGRLPRDKAGPFKSLSRHGLRTFWNRQRVAHPTVASTVLHTYRHTCASRLAQRGAPLLMIKDWMGHKAIQTTQRYTHLCPTNLNALMDLLSPTAPAPA